MSNNATGTGHAPLRRSARCAALSRSSSSSLRIASDVGQGESAKDEVRRAVQPKESHRGRSKKKQQVPTKARSRSRGKTRRTSASASVSAAPAAPAAQQLQPQPLQPQSSVTPQLHSLRLTQRLSAAKVMGGGTAKGHPHQRQQLLPLAEKVAEGRRTRSGSKARNQLRLQHQSLHFLSSILLEEDHHHHNHYLPLQLLPMRGLLRERQLP